MALIDKETIRKEYEKQRDYHASINTAYYMGRRDEDCDILSFIDTIPEQPKDDKEQTVNLPKWQKLKNIDSYSDRKTWKDDKVLFVTDSEGYLYGCSIRELFDKLPKEK